MDWTKDEGSKWRFCWMKKPIQLKFCISLSHTYVTYVQHKYTLIITSHHTQTFRTDNKYKIFKSQMLCSTTIDFINWIGKIHYWYLPNKSPESFSSFIFLFPIEKPYTRTHIFWFYFHIKLLGIFILFDLQNEAFLRYFYRIYCFHKKKHSCFWFLNIKWMINWNKEYYISSYLYIHGTNRLKLFSVDVLCYVLPG